MGAEIVGHDLTRRDQWSAWFRLDAAPGVLVVVTMGADGEVVGFEAHAQGSERSWPLDRGEQSVTVLLPPTEPVDISITARLLRSVRLAALADLARSRLGVSLRWRPEEFEAFDEQTRDALGGRAIDSARLARQQAQRPGRRGRGDRYYAELAVAYEVWLDSGEPLRTLASEVHLSEPGLRTALATARRRGLLSPAPRGRAGGQATERAKALLAEVTETNTVETSK